MKYPAILITILSVLLFFNCSKKDLPAPNSLNRNNTGISLQNGSQTASVTPPCASSLQNNKISYTYSPSGTAMYFSPQADEFMGELDITCSDYSTYNKIRITLPYRYSFVGIVKYPVTNIYFSHSYNSFYTSASYAAYEGDIYVEYTQTQIIVSFCSVKVQDSYSNHLVTGQVIFANNF